MAKKEAERKCRDNPKIPFKCSSYDWSDIISGSTCQYNTYSNKGEYLAQYYRSEYEIRDRNSETEMANSEIQFESERISCLRFKKPNVTEVVHCDSSLTASENGKTDIEVS
jgi:hypothetical protein